MGGGREERGGTRRRGVCVERSVVKWVGSHFFPSAPWSNTTLPPPSSKKKKQQRDLYADIPQTHCN